jgi:hypothetical protein
MLAGRIGLKAEIHFQAKKFQELGRFEKTCHSPLRGHFSVAAIRDAHVNCSFLWIHGTSGHRDLWSQFYGCGSISQLKDTAPHHPKNSRNW